MTIPRLDMRQVETAPLPTIRVPTDVPDASLGAPPHIELGGLSHAFDEQWKKEKERADQISVMSADAKAADLETKLLYDPEKGALNLKGRDSLNARDVISEGWKQGMDDISADLHNDTQRLAFQRAALGRFDNLNQTVARHISTELEKYDDDQTQASLTNEGNAATAAAVPGVNMGIIADRSTLAIARQRSTIMDYAKRKGLSPEKRQEMLDQYTSSTHASVISKLIANDDDITAENYFKEFQDQLVGKDLTEATKEVEASSLRGESQRKTDEIMDANKDNMQGAIDAVRKIENPKLRDAVRTRVENEFQVQAAIKREEQEQLYLTATNAIEADVQKGVPFVASDVVPSKVWSQLPITARTSLERRALHADADYPNDSSVWHDFLELDQKQMAALSKMEFETKYWAHFDRETRLRSELMWTQAIDAARTGRLNDKMAADLTFRDLLKNTVDRMDPRFQKKASKDWTQDMKDFFNNFTIEAMRRKEAEESSTKKPMTHARMNELMDDMVKTRVFLDKPLKADPYRLPGELSVDERKQAYVPYENIPDAAKNEIEEMAKKAGGGAVPMRRKIERLYAARVMNNAKLFLSILQEK